LPYKILFANYYFSLQNFCTKKSILSIFCTQMAHIVGFLAKNCSKNRKMPLKFEKPQTSL